MHFEAPYSPTDIIWENRQQDDWYWVKFSMVTIQLTALMLIQFYIVYVISKWEQDVNDMFPQVDCDFINDMYGDQLQTQAIADFNKLVDGAK